MDAYKEGYALAQKIFFSMDAPDDDVTSNEIMRVGHMIGDFLYGLDVDYRVKSHYMKRMNGERDWKLLFQKLTPGGSEFTEPKECFEWVVERMELDHKTIIRLQKTINGY